MCDDLASVATQEGEKVASSPDEVEEEISKDVSGDLVMDLTDDAASADEDATGVAEAKTNPTEIGTIAMEAKTEPKRRRRKRSRTTKMKDKDAPKRPLTSFLLYGEETRAALQEELGTKELAVVSKELAARYKRLPKDKVEELQRLSAENRAKYKKDIEEYQKNNPVVKEEMEVEGLDMDGLVKKPADAYRIFSKEERAKVVKELGAADPREVTRELGARWRALPQERLQEYQRVAEEARLEYRKAVAAARALAAPLAPYFTFLAAGTGVEKVGAEGKS